MEREKTLALLREMHSFPGPYGLKVVTHPHAVAAVVSAVGATLAAPGDVLEISERASRTGKYVSVSLRVHVADAEMVLAIYETLRGVDGVVTTL